MSSRTSAHSKLSQCRAHISQIKHAEEHAFVERLLSHMSLSELQRKSTLESAKAIVKACRADTRSQTLLDSFLQEFGLSNKEGVALMCLAEALLRVPDKTTADRLIAEKIVSGDWQSHSGNSDSVFVNSATWGMILTGKLIQLDDEITQQPGSWLKKLSSNLSEPIVRRAILQAMRIMGGQYVLGRTIQEGVKKGARMHTSNTLYSFDMLGEAARTKTDAERYYQSYANALDKVGKLNKQQDVYTTDGVSVKLSALHPQYHFSHAQAVMDELLPRITALCLKAKQYNIGLSIDAEEAARLELSLDIFESLCRNPELKGWNGLGFVLQAYQKRAPSVARWLVQLAQETDRKLMVRLVKGAYWDAEIKHAQEQGLEDYPVFTRKVNTDACYLHCADILLKAKGSIFAQFATHNAYTTVAIVNLAQSLGNMSFEFQRLHGMGELLYKYLLKYYQKLNLPLRVYAPIGKHEDLLPYLVRRLLENGANSSFVNRFLDNETPVNSLIQDVYTDAASHDRFRHSKIPLPAKLFEAAGEMRENSKGLDLDDANTVDKISKAIQSVANQSLEAHSIVSGEVKIGDTFQIVNPSQSDQQIGVSSQARPEMIEAALANANAAHQAWANTSATERARILNKAADLLENNQLELIGIINTEAGRTIADCVSEVREAVDFCRYYALQITAGQVAQSDAQGQGVFFCISPWNFPLAIFVGQVVAAIAAGNCVLAKPAEQTPLVAARAVALLHEAGCPSNVLHLLVGDGPKIGAQLIPDPRINGIAFTGSTTTAQHINQQIAQRAGETIPLIAETGGQNCMIIDSTALPEQVVDDVISSAFHSAGQRCSALRVLYVQDVIADKVINMLKGAMDSIKLGNPQNLSSDVGPVIDQRARDSLFEHLDYIRPLSKQEYSATISPTLENTGTYFAPRLYEIDSISVLKREVFGPVLHIIRYNSSDIDSVIDDINSTGYSLTFGVHSRIEAFAEYVFRKTTAGNTYINRNTIGAVVGVNPFGGRGLSGTGPKAGGPNYLYRFLRNGLGKRSANLEDSDTAIPENLESNTPCLEDLHSTQTAWRKLTVEERCAKLLKTIDEQLPESLLSISQMLSIAKSALIEIVELPGPTGEENQLHLSAKGTVLLALGEHDELSLAAHISALILSAGNSIILSANGERASMIAEKLAMIFSEQAVTRAALSIGLLSHSEIAAVAVATDNPKLPTIRTCLAMREGPIVPLLEFDSSVTNPKRAAGYLNFFIDERTRTDNLVARGGNTQLFNLDE